VNCLSTCVAIHCPGQGLGKGTIACWAERCCVNFLWVKYCYVNEHADGPSHWLQSGPYLRTGPRGPGPGRQIFRGGISKKSRLKYGMRKKKAVHERNLREIYIENNVGTEFPPYDATGRRGGRKNFLGPGA